MTRDDIIRMAHEAYCSRVNLHTDQKASISRLERFAALIVAAERERFCSDLRGLHDVYSLQPVSPIRERDQA